MSHIVGSVMGVIPLHCRVVPPALHPTGAGAGSVIPSPPCCHRQVAPVIPLYEQLLKGMGVGAVSSTVVWCGVWMALAVSTHDPPHEQSLMGMEQMLCWMLLSSSREGGGGVISVMW